MHAPTISIKSLKDDVETPLFDFTPDNRRIFARELKVQSGAEGRPGSVHVRLNEWDRYDPTQMDLSVCVTPTLCETPFSTSIECPVTVAELDALIGALTLARDAAICEGMIAPAVPAIS
jgi:hypothetical protein